MFHIINVPVLLILCLLNIYLSFAGQLNGTFWSYTHTSYFFLLQPLSIILYYYNIAIYMCMYVYRVLYTMYMYYSTTPFLFVSHLLISLLFLLTEWRARAHRNRTHGTREEYTHTQQQLNKSDSHFSFYPSIVLSQLDVMISKIKKRNFIRSRKVAHIIFSIFSKRI